MKADRARKAREAEAGEGDEAKVKAEGDDMDMVAEEEEEDPVPEITIEHFEEAMRFARRSVSGQSRPFLVLL